MTRSNLEVYEPDHPVVQRAVEVLREMARDGMAPGQGLYNARCRTLGAVHANTLWTHGWLWADLVELSGLQMSGRSTARAMRAAREYKARRDDGVPAAVEEEIRQAFARGDHEPVHHREWPIQVIPTRVEVKRYVLPDGSIYQATRAYASVR